MSMYVKYLDVPDGAQEHMDFSNGVGLNNQVINLSLIRTGAKDIPYATLEPGIWKLDGTRELLCENESGTYSAGNEVLYWGVQPSFYLSFSNFSETISATGLSFVFSPSTNQWEKQVYIAWYLNDTLLDSVTVYPDSPVYVVNKNVDGFNKIYIAAKGSNIENGFSKIQKITIGREVTFGKGAISDVSLLEELDPSLCVLTADTLSFSVVSKTALTPKEGQRLELYRDDVLECVQFVKDCERISKDRYRIIGQSLIYMMDQETFYGKIYTPGGTKNSTDRCGNVWCDAKTLIERIFKGFSHDINISYETDQDHGTPVEKTTLGGYLPICTMKEALQQVCFASGMTVKTRDGNLTLSELPTSSSSTFYTNSIFNGTSVKNLSPISDVNVASIQERNVKEDWVVLEGEYPSGSPVYEFERFTQLAQEPYYNGGIMVAKKFSGDYGAGWFSLSGVSQGDQVSVSADNYIEFQKKTHTRTVSSTAKKKNPLTVSDCTLLYEGYYTNEWDSVDEIYALSYKENVTDVLDRLAEYAQLRTLVEQDVVASGQHAGDLVRTQTPWGTTVEGYIISMDSILTQNGQKARVKILGKEVS